MEESSVEMISVLNLLITLGFMCSCVRHLFNVLYELDVIPLYHFLDLLGLKIALSPQNVKGTQKQVQISLHWKKLKGLSPSRMWAIRKGHGKLRRTSIDPR